MIMRFVVVREDLGIGENYLNDPVTLYLTLKGHWNRDISQARHFWSQWEADNHILKVLNGDKRFASREYPYPETP